MTVLNVLIYPHSGLRIKAKTVEVITPEIKQHAQNMLETMYAQDGVGLAATQVGIHWRIFTMDTSPDGDSPQVLINPRITEKNGKVTHTEGCLSFPGLSIDVERAERIKVEATDLDGQAIAYEADGLTARCIQHELDHLDGIVFTDHLSRIKQDRAHKKVLKFVRDNQLTPA